ncbi:conserved exported hypothetical protein [uncultured Paludibacter sp.]|nr:conserved exported hypothetical protein [uncultured Paludibacter sp.]
MKTIKLSLVALATLFSFTFANAQFGLQAGYSTQNQTTSVDGNEAGSNSISGFYIGPVYEMSVQGPVSLTYGLLYSYLTGDHWSSLLPDPKMVGHQLDLPVRVQFGFPVAEDISLIGFAGPNFSFVVSEKVGDTNLADVKMENGKKKYSPFDVQLGLGAGVKFKMLTLKASYDWGMLDRENSDTQTIKANDLKIGIAYNF